MDTRLSWTVPGFRIGHAQLPSALTGCTVVLADHPAVVGVDVRGSAPATRETDLCRPGTLVERADAVLLTGGSAFGLEAAGGVMQYLREQGRGFPTAALPIPIVPAAAIFDLAIGEPRWPDANLAYDACLAARSRFPPDGGVGAGAGATVGKLYGMGRATKSGFGCYLTAIGNAYVGALVVVNAFGDINLPDDGTIIAGARAADGSFVHTSMVLRQAGPASATGLNTTIGVIITNVALDSAAASHLAAIAHDGLARVINPAHTMFDGDAFFTLSGGDDAQASMPALEAATVLAVERAILTGVIAAEPAGGLPARTIPPHRIQRVDDILQ